MIRKSGEHLLNLASLGCDMECWLSCRVSALQSVITGLISSGGDQSIHCWTDLIRSKQPFLSVVHKGSLDFLVMVIQITMNVICLTVYTQTFSMIFLFVSAVISFSMIFLLVSAVLSFSMIFLFVCHDIGWKTNKEEG